MRVNRQQEAPGVVLVLAVVLVSLWAGSLIAPSAGNPADYLATIRYRRLSGTLLWRCEQQPSARARGDVWCCCWPPWRPRSLARAGGELQYSGAVVLVPGRACAPPRAQLGRRPTSSRPDRLPRLIHDRRGLMLEVRPWCLVILVAAGTDPRRRRRVGRPPGPSTLRRRLILATVAAAITLALLVRFLADLLMG